MIFDTVLKKTAVSLFLLAAALLTACSDGSIETESTSASASAVTAETETETMFKQDTLQEGLNWGGKTVSIIYRDDVIDEFRCEEQIGEIVDDAIWLSNRNVEERLNIELKVTPLAGSANKDRKAYIDSIIKAALAGDGTYDIVTGMTYMMPTLVQNGVLTDLFTVEHVDFAQPWWNQTLTEMCTVDGSLYYASGDVSLSIIKCVECLYFNDALFDSLGFCKNGDMYDIVLDGKWTVEKLRELAVAAYADLNGDGKVDVADRYGCAVRDVNHIDGFSISCGMEVFKKDKLGAYEFVFANERGTEVVQYMCSLFNNNRGIFLNTVSDASTDLTMHDALKNMFIGGRLLFITAELNHAVTLFREMDDYGILPYPKWSEGDEYRSYVRNTYSSVAVPVSAADTKTSGAVLEAIASENYRTVSPVYFEQALKVKYSRDDSDAKMYDIIRAGITLDFGYSCQIIFGITNNFRDAIIAHDDGWVSRIGALEKTVLTKLESYQNTVKSFK